MLGYGHPDLGRFQMGRFEASWFLQKSQTLDHILAPSPSVPLEMPQPLRVSYVLVISVLESRVKLPGARVGPRASRCPLPGLDEMGEGG